MACKCNLRKRINKAKLKPNNREVYLDYCSTTQPDQNTLRIVDKINRNLWGNISAQNSRGVALYNYIVMETEKCLQTFEIPNYLYYFDTSSTSIVNRIKYQTKNRKIVTSECDHISIIDRADFKLKVNEGGEIDIDKILEINTNKNLIFIYSIVNHETGNIQDFKYIYDFCKKNNIFVIIDGVQTISRIYFKEWINYCDGFYFSGHKIHGLQGAASLYIKPETIDFKTKDHPIPFSLYTGTFNSVGVAALLEATINLGINIPNDISTLKVLHTDALQILKEIPDFTMESNVNGAPGIINFSIPDINTEEFLLKLNEDDIEIGRLSACSGDITAESYVLKAMGRSSNRCKTSLRVSFGKYSKRDDFFRLRSSICDYLRLQ